MINTCKDCVHFLDEIGPSCPVEVACLRGVQVGSLVVVAVVVFDEGTVHLLTTMLIIYISRSELFNTLEFISELSFSHISLWNAVAYDLDGFLTGRHES